MTGPESSPDAAIPAWASSVTAFASATNQSRILSSASPIQFPDTSGLDICGNTLGGQAFTGGLMDYADPSMGSVGSLIGGTQHFANGLCGLSGAAPAETTPQSVLSGMTDVSGAINANTMASGTITLGQTTSGPTNNVALDAINGTQHLAGQLFGMIQGCGCGGQYSPDTLTPAQVVDTAGQTSDAIANQPMASGLMAMGASAGGTNQNVALNAINGSQIWANQLFGILSVCGCGGATHPTVATPSAVTNTAQATADRISSSVVGSYALSLGQAANGGPSGNVATDMIDGGDIWFTGVATAASSASTTATAAQDSASQAATAAANVAAAIAQQRAAAVANDAIGGDYITIVPSGSDGAALPTSQWIPH